MKRKSLRRAITIACAATAIVTGSLRAQSITAALDAPPEGRLRMTDLWSLVLVNHGAKSVDILLVATVRDSLGQTVFKGRAKGPTIPGSQTRRIRMGDLRGIAIEEISPQIRAAISQTGALPDGRWKLCIEAVAVNGGNASDCRELLVGSALPPVLLAPYDNAEVTDRQVAWSWFMQPRTTSGQEVRCNLVVVEILPGQTPEEALRVNPVLIRRKDLKAAAWQADPAVRPFRSGHRYAWRIQAVVGEGSEVCASEIWTFVYRDPSEVAPPPSGPPDRRYSPDDAGPAIDPATIPDPPADTAGPRNPSPAPDVPPVPSSSRGDRSRGVIDIEEEATMPAPPDNKSGSRVDSFPDDGSAGTSDDGEDVDDASSQFPNPGKTTDPVVGGDASSADSSNTNRPRISPRLGSAPAELPVDDQAFIGDTVPLRFSAVSRLMLESASRSGRLAETPPTFVRWEFAPTVRLYGMPLAINLLLSTERQPAGSRPGVDRGAFQFQRNVGDFNMALIQRVQGRLDQAGDDGSSGDTAIVLSRLLDSLARAVRDTGFFADTAGLGSPMAMREIAVDLETLRDLGLVAPAEAALMNLPSLGFGVVAPTFGELFMQGVSMNGGMAEYNPGLFYLGGAIGTMNREDALLLPPSTEQGSEGLAVGDLPTPRRMVYVGRLGIGRRDGTHIIASALYAEDDAASQGLARLVEGIGGSFASQRNIVAGLAGRFRDEALRLTLDGEVNASLLNDGSQGPTIEGDLFREASTTGVLFGDAGAKAGSIADLAWRGRLFWQPTDESRLVLGGRYVGPGYTSVGTAGLRSDLLRLDASFDQLLFRHRVALQGEVSHESSGGSIDGATVATIDRVALGGDLRIPGLPMLTLRYAATTQHRVIGDGETVNDAATEHRQGSVTMAYDRLVGHTRIGAFVAATYQDALSDEEAGAFSSLGFSATGRVGFGSILGGAVTYGLNKTTTAVDRLTVAVPSLGATLFATPVDWMQGRGTILLRRLSDREVTTITLGGTMNLWSFGTLDVQYERNIFSSDEEDEGFLRATIMVGM